MVLTPATDRPWTATAKPILKVALTLLVLGFVIRHVLHTRRDLLARGLSLRIDYGWLAAAVGLYLLGLTACGAYFYRVLAHSATPVGPYPAIRAYLISHLAKYVPGKAMVVVVRSSLVAEAGARPATAAFATLYETLTMMAAGGLVAAAGFLATSGLLAASSFEAGGPSLHVSLRRVGINEVLDVPFAVAGLGAGLAFAVPVWPTLFPRLAGLIRRPLRSVGADALPRLSVALLLEGLAWTTLGWVLLGLSQVATIAALGGLGGATVLGPQFWPAVVASVALATVAGFAVPIAPGGLGVREWVLWTTLAAALDEDLAVVAASLLRLVWVAGEVAVAAGLILIRPRSGRSPG